MSNLLVQNIKHTNGTTAQTIDSSGNTTLAGNVTLSTQPRFLVQLTSNAGVADGKDDDWSTTTASWTEKFDVGGCFSGGLFTSPVAGVYHITFQMYCNPSAGSYIGATMNGTAIDDNFGVNDLWHFQAGGNDTGFTHTALVNCSASGKTIRFGTYGNGTSTARYDGTFIFGYRVA